MNIQIAKWFFYIGIGFIGMALLIYFFTKIGFPLGKLPGDIQFKGEKYGIYFPIVTSLILSIVLTLILNLILWLFRK